MLPSPIRVLTFLVLIHQSKLNCFMECLWKGQTETLISLHITVLPAAVRSFFATHISIEFFHYIHLDIAGEVILSTGKSVCLCV